MSAKIFWTLPPSGDGRSAAVRRGTRGFAGTEGSRGFGNLLTDARGRGYTYYDYLLQVARAAEVTGFEGVLIPWDPEGEEPWIVASSLSREARRLTFLPELQPGFATPVYLAKMSVSFQRLTRNRLAWKFDVERDASVRRAHGDFLDGEDWFARADEYLEAAKGVWTQRPYDFRGRFYDVKAGGFEGPLSGLPLPSIYTSGRSDAALALAGKHADVHVLEPGNALHVQLELERLARAGALHQRSPKGALRLAIVARHSDEEAWSVVRDQRADAGLSTEITAAERAASLWTGFDKIGFDTPVGLVGSYAAVAARLQEVVSLGIETLILSGRPHLEEAYRLGEHVISKLSSQVQAASRTTAVNVSAAP